MGAVAIKVGDGEAYESTVREAAVLDQLREYRVWAEAFEGGVWMVSPWEDGPSTWKVFAPARRGPDGREAALRGAVDLCQAVSDFHLSGWVHGDLQPTHGIHTEHGVRLIDFAWSWQWRLEPTWSEFNGAMFHLMAPELAAGIEAGEQPARTHRPAEVYTLAATLWACATGDWPLDYAGVGTERRAVDPLELRKVIATSMVPLASPDVWPELLAVLRPVLLSSAGDRPTALELARALANLN
ncbi:hypothetical protein ACIRPK_04520 [Kitasatospora sp. NPDC101801]|uniref:hypothetical protein n=1 Tax=Kitasatospora sp. NPDC101801 TaxID=3364103 RepID=UPI0037F95FCB